MFCSVLFCDPGAGSVGSPLTVSKLMSASEAVSLQRVTPSYSNDSDASCNALLSQLLSIRTESKVAAEDSSHEDMTFEL